VPNVEGAYCAEADMRTGDLRVPSYTTKAQYIQNAAEEIDTALGHLYVTPFIISNTPANRPTILFLKKVNWLLASGRFVLDVAAAGEQDNLHAYGKRMLDEAMKMLEDAALKKVTLPGTTPLAVPQGQEDYTGPHISNEDSESLVEAFYRRQRPYADVGEPFPRIPVQVTPYGD
jgi:hypothetical protein